MFYYQISAEPFTTLRPNVGNVKIGNRKLTIADLPGLIDGAHTGRGAGDLFLSMIERNNAHIFVVDINGFQLNTTSPYRNFSKSSIKKSTLIHGH